jgi:hypothetical protein
MAQKFSVSGLIVAIAPPWEISVKPRNRGQKQWIIRWLAAARRIVFSRVERRQVNDARRYEQESRERNFRFGFRARPHSAPSFPRFFARASSS